MTAKDFRILLALCDAKMNTSLIERLKRYYTVSAASTALETSDLIHVLRPQIAVIDYDLPDLNPIELGEGLDFVHPSTHIILCVNDENLQVARRIWKKRAIDYIRKPINAGRIEDDINKIVRHLLDKELKLKLRKRVKELSEENQKLRNML